MRGSGETASSEEAAPGAAPGAALPDEASQGEASEGSARSRGIVSVGTVLTVVGALLATLLGGGLAGRANTLRDGNTWLLAAAKDGIERVLRVNPGSGEVDIEAPLPPLPKGSPDQIRLEQSNAGTAVVDESSGETFSWDATAGQWQRSPNRFVAGSTDLLLTASAAFAVDHAGGQVRQLEPAQLSDVGAPLRLRGEVTASVADGTDLLWLAVPSHHQVVAVQAGTQGPTVRREYELTGAGMDLRLTPLKSGVMVGDLSGSALYRALPGRDAVERIADLPGGSGAITASSSDDDTGAVLSPQAGTLTRVAPAGDRRAQSFSLGALAGHEFGPPVVFSDHVYLADYSTGLLLQAADGAVEPVAQQPRLDPGKFDVFVDDGRLWANAPTGEHAFSVDGSGRVVPVDKSSAGKVNTAPRPAKTIAARTGSPRVPRKSTAPPAQRPAAVKRPASTTPAAGPTTAASTSSGPAAPVPVASPATPATTPPVATTSASPSPTPQPPGAPANLGAAPGDGTLAVTWQPPVVGAGTVPGYVVQWSPAGGGSGGQATVAAGTRSHTIPGLTNGTRYTVTVRATGVGQQGTAAETTATPAGRPTIGQLSARAGSRGQVVVDLSATGNGGGTLTCTLAVGGTSRAVSCSGTQTFTGLADGTAYDVTLTATNSQGSSTRTQSVTTIAAPQPTMTISKGARVTNGQCNSSSCAWVDIQMQNFTPGTTYTISASSTYPGGPDFNPISVTVDANGSATIPGLNRTFFFGYPGYQLWVTASGVQSNRITW
jgi:hypothetical protein